MGLSRLVARFTLKRLMAHCTLGRGVRDLHRSAIRRADQKERYALGGARCGSGSLSFPKLQIGMKDGFCAGLVASEEDGLIFPRSIVQIPGSDQFVISDMVGWGSPSGKLLVLDPAAGEGHRIRTVVSSLDSPFGLAVGPDHKIYASTAETIFRFDPLAASPSSTIEVVVKNLPGAACHAL